MTMTVGSLDDCMMHMFTVMTCAVRIHVVSVLYSVPESSHDLRSSIFPRNGPSYHDVSHHP